MITTPKHLAAAAGDRIGRSERQLRRAAACGSLVIDHKKISGSWILSRGRPLDQTLIGTREAARRLQISRREVQIRCKEGTLPAQKVGGVWLIRLPEKE